MTGTPGGAAAEGELLIGILAGPTEVQAMLVERTPFGRLAPAGRRVVTDVDGPTHFVPLTVERQLVGGSVAAPDEERAADAWIQSIANAVAKLTFGLHAPRARVGVALDAQLDGRGRRVVAARGGPRVDDVPGTLGRALAGRNLALAAPIGRCVTVAEAWALGEAHSALGSLGSMERGERALLVHWDIGVTWLHLVAGGAARVVHEPSGSRADVGFESLDRLRGSGEGSRMLLPAARRGDAEAITLLVEAARALGKRAGARLVQDERDTARGAAEGTRALGRSRVVLAGTLGRALLDERLGSALQGAFAGALGAELAEAPALALRAGWLQPEGDGEGDGAEAPDAARPGGLAPGVLHVSREASAPLIGAASLALGAAGDDHGAPTQ